MALARHGLLVRDPAGLELLPRADTILLDKTGTLTTPAQFRLRAGRGDAALIGAALEASGHALGGAVTTSAAGPEALTTVPGAGAVGEHRSGSFRMGRPGWLIEQGQGGHVPGVTQREGQPGHQAQDHHAESDGDDAEEHTPPVARREDP